MFPLIVYFVFLLVGFSKANCGDDILLNIGRVDNEFYLWGSSWQTRNGNIESLQVQTAESHRHVITKGFTYHPITSTWPTGYHFNGDFTNGYNMGFFGTQYTIFIPSINHYKKDWVFTKEFLDRNDGYYKPGAAVSVHTEHSIYSPNIIISSDERIKRDIETVPQNLSLDIVRKLDTKYYKYVDDTLRGRNRTIGFIAQDVLDVIPEAVNAIRNYIPDEMRIVNASFINNQMTLAETLKSGMYRFFMINDSDPSERDPSESRYDLETKDGRTFNVSFTGHKKVFLYGSLVEDFLTINKNKIFSVAYAALRQIDENQQRLEKQIEDQERRIEDIKTKLSVLN